MYTRSVTIRKVSQSYDIPELVQLACSFKSVLKIRNNEGEFNAKSIMGMMSLDPTDGPLYITGSGEDEKDAVDSIAAFLTR